MDLYVNGTSGQKPNGNSGRLCEHWNRIPDSVLHDPRLSFAAKCVYGVLAGSVHQGTVARIGQRLIAARLGCHQETVSSAIQELAQWRHVVVTKFGKQRYSYHLTSDVFGQKQRALDAGEATVEELVSSPRPRLATVRKTA
jgi:hypothetical protein